MDNADEINSDPAQDRDDLLDAPIESRTAQGGISSLLSIRTLAAGIAGAAVAALILGAVVLFLRSDDNAPIQILLPDSTQPASPANSADLADDLKVYVTGAVVNPGVYSLTAGDRVSDAIDAAGGTTSDAQTEAVNLALRVQDEGHYQIPRLGETPIVDAITGFKVNQATGATAVGTCDGLIDLNTASIELLESLPTIGQVRAAAIVSYRKDNGRFQSVEDITNVSGIGPATYEAIRGLATVCDTG